jgi:hypothetical protein
MAQELDEERPADRVFNQTKGEPQVAGHIRARFGNGRIDYPAVSMALQRDRIKTCKPCKVYGSDTALWILRWRGFIGESRLSFALGEGYPFVCWNLIHNPVNPKNTRAFSCIARVTLGRRETCCIAVIEPYVRSTTTRRIA